MYQVLKLNMPQASRNGALSKICAIWLSCSGALYSFRVPVGEVGVRIPKTQVGEFGVHCG